MNSTPDNIDELIAMVLTGEALPDQVEVVMRWREASDQNRRHFDHMKLIFEKAGSINDAIAFDTDEAWNRLKSSLSKGRKSVPIERGRSEFSFLKIAAGLAILIAAGVFAYTMLFTNRTESGELYAGNETLADTLPDGSEVFLNRRTSITYAYNKREGKHVAQLTGEAYFEIAHKENTDFVVQAGETFIKDIGTSFNVKAYPDSGVVEVMVDEGEVLFYTSQDAGVHVKANGRGLYDQRTGRFTVGDPEPNTTSYKTKSFTFSNHSLRSVVQALNRVYDTKLEIDDKLRNCKLTVSFNDERIDEIAQVIADTHGLTVVEEGDTIRLLGTGCGEAPTK